MRIYICDDEELFIEEEKRICLEFFGDCKDIDIITGKNGHDVLAYDGMIDILLLDIDMPGLDGIALKNNMDNTGKAANIIYVTNHAERMREAFGKNVIGFVDKQNVQKELTSLLSKIYSEMSYILIEGDNGERYRSNNIRYIEAEGQNYIRIYMKNGENIMVRGSLSVYEKQLSGVDYVRIHRGYLVNMNEIGRITKSGVIIGTKVLPISIRKQSEIRRIYTEYKRKKMRYT